MNRYVPAVRLSGEEGPIQQQDCEALERRLRAQGSPVCLSPGELQQFSLLGQKGLCASLAGAATPAERAELGRIEAAASAQLAALAPDSAAYQLHRARSLRCMGHTQAAAEGFRRVLRASEATKAHLGAYKAVQLLLPLITRGAEGTGYSLTEAYHLLDRADTALSLAKAWIPDKDVIRQEAAWLALHRQDLDTAARTVQAFLPGCTRAPAVPDLPSAQPGPPPINTAKAPANCAGCGTSCLQMMRCSRCGAARYCSKECQRKPGSSTGRSVRARRAAKLDNTMQPCRRVAAQLGLH
ncbi:hypothetical protein ABPG75_013788 [Micractinium tetrahymenae]